MRAAARRLTAGCVLGAALLLAGCAGAGAPEPSAPPEAVPPSPAAVQAEKNQSAAGEEEDAAMTMDIQIGEAVFSAALEGNAAAHALAELLEDGPLTLTLRDHGGFEKVGALGTGLPAEDAQTTARPGDIVLYQGDQLVLFYGSNTWSYTRLGQVDDLDGWENALGAGDVTVVLSLEGQPQ